jgi:geranylgeranyl diphosphate synthase type I
MRARAAGEPDTDFPNGPAAALPSCLRAVRPQADEELRTFLERRRSEVEGVEPGAAPLVEELIRLVAAGGKRIRPAMCYWGYRAAGGGDERRIIRAAAALELLHTFAIVHDDVMDRSPVRRGVAATHARLAEERRRRVPGGDSVHFGMSIAILAGDLAAVYADRMFLESGFPPDRLIEPKRRYDAMRVDMAAGQYLDLTGGPDVEEPLARRISSLKTGSYTIRGPLLIGAALAGGSSELDEVLSNYAAPLGEAFQVRDDVAGVLAHEGDLVQGRPTIVHAKARRLVAPERRERLAVLGPAELAQALRTSGALDAAIAHANRLVEEALMALASAELPPGPAEALRELAELVAIAGPRR